jgi:glycine dehydrogenase subunit 1
VRYLPHTEDDIREMLEVVGRGSIDELFETIPADCRRESPLEIPGPLTEWELDEHMEALASAMATAGTGCKVFLGAGSYEHYIPEVIPYLVSRSEFSTAYTPYQPEISQGTLQALFEYQTYTARLLGMEIANASLYDGATALAEALLMAMRVTRRTRIALSRLIHPHYRAVVRTYLRPADVEVIELPCLADGRTDAGALEALEDCAAVAVQSPNFFGCLEDVEACAAPAHRRGALLVCCFTEPLAYGLFKNPGSQGADIACGEGQSLGIPHSFGGPGLGMFACRKEYLRAVPGRLVGQTRDMDGKRGFVLTLSGREQHIRREKATSNICTNNNLCALTATMYMACLGRTGLGRLARLNFDKSQYLKKQLAAAGYLIPFEAPTFNEFVVQFPEGFETTYERLCAKGIVAGLPLARFYPECAGRYLLCVTETKTKEDLDAFLRELGS